MLNAIRLTFASAGLGFLFGAIPVAAQDVVRVRGTIERIEGDAYVAKARDGNTLHLKLAAKRGDCRERKVRALRHKAGLLHRCGCRPAHDGDAPCA